MYSPLVVYKTIPATKALTSKALIVPEFFKLSTRYKKVNGKMKANNFLTAPYVWDYINRKYVMIDTKYLKRKSMILRFERILNHIIHSTGHNGYTWHPFYFDRYVRTMCRVVDVLNISKRKNKYRLVDMKDLYNDCAYNDYLMRRPTVIRNMIYETLETKKKSKLLNST